MPALIKKTLKLAITVALISNLVACANVGPSAHKADFGYAPHVAAAASNDLGIEDF